MVAALASADIHIWMSILVKASAYAATLVAAGSVLVSLVLRELSARGCVSLRRVAFVAALAAAALSVLRLPLRASFLAGGSLEGALDPLLLGLVAESPLGTSVILRLVGLALILAILLPSRIAPWIAAAGAVLVCASFAFRGHALGEPRLILGALVTVHILGLAFWLGAFAPLARAARVDTPAEAGALAHEFGTKAMWLVAALVAAGALTLGLLGAATPVALTTPYGQIFLVKLGLFAGVLLLAALNKLRLTPELLSASPGADARLRRSIGVEAALIALILATTAALTTVTSPPREAAQAGMPPDKKTLASTTQSSGDPTWQL